jgi:hypothetical protein
VADYAVLMALPPDGQDPSCWYEVRIPRTPEYQKVVDSFLDDYDRARVEANLPPDGLRYSESGGAERYFLPPEAAASYFLSPCPTAIATWLRAIDLAKPCPTLPDGEELKPVPK